MKFFFLCQTKSHPIVFIQNFKNLLIRFPRLILRTALSYNLSYYKISFYYQYSFLRERGIIKNKTKLQISCQEKSLVAITYQLISSSVIRVMLYLRCTRKLTSNVSELLLYKLKHKSNGFSFFI